MQFSTLKAIVSTSLKKKAITKQVISMNQNQTAFLSQMIKENFKNSYISILTQHLHKRFCINILTTV